MVERILHRVPVHLVPNVGNRCTLVCAATLLRYHGATAPGMTLAVQIGEQTHYRPETGPPALAYVAFPWRRPALDLAIELVAGRAGSRVQARTRLLPTPGSIIRAIGDACPVVLNMVRAPSGAWSHSVVAYGYRLSDQSRVQLLTVDPNQPERSPLWLDAYRPWRCSVATATFVSLKPERQADQSHLPR